MKSILLYLLLNIPAKKDNCKAIADKRMPYPINGLSINHAYIFVCKLLGLKYMKPACCPCNKLEKLSGKAQALCNILKKPELA